MYKVVIIDDEPIIAEGLGKSINWAKFGCEVVGMGFSGEEGLKLIREIEPDIIFTDIRMPRMDGLTMVAAIKSQFPGTQIAILTGYRDFDYAQRAIRLGVTRFLLKPSKMDEIMEALTAMTDKLKRRSDEYESLREAIWGDEEKGEISPDGGVLSGGEVRPDGGDAFPEGSSVLSGAAEIPPDGKGGLPERSEAFSGEREGLPVGREAFSEGVETLAEGGEALQEGRAGSFLVKNAVAYIEEHCQEKLKLSDVADQVYVSQWHLSKLLNRYQGQNFSEILNGVRIEKAKELLKDPALRIGDIADEVGFSDMAHFSRVFKKTVGISANEYRNQL